MAELRLLPESEPRNVVGDWTVRGGVAVVFLIFGMEKFSSDAASHWVTLFQEIGAGEWFRYFTGAVEVFGSLLVLIPRTATIGLAILAATMAGAVIILISVIGRTADSIFPAIFLVALAAIQWSRRWQ